MYNSYGTFYHNGYSELYHHGVKGQKHGTRRWQNADGSLTPAGYEHYGYGKRRINKQTGKSEFVINERALAKREKALAKQNAIQDKREEKGKKATTRQYNAAVWDSVNSPAAKAKGRKIVAATFLAGIPAASLVGSIALGSAVLATPGWLPLVTAKGIGDIKRQKKDTQGIQKYRTQNTHQTSTHATNKKDIQDVKNMTATKEMKSKINSNNTTVKRDQYGRITSYKVSL